MNSNASTEYTQKSHISAVLCTRTYHWPIPTNAKIHLSSYRFIIFQVIQHPNRRVLLLGNSPQRAPSRQASYTRTGCLVLVVPSRELPIFHTKTQILIPLDPKFDPRLIHLITNIKRHSKQQQQTSYYNTNSSQNHHLVHFHQQPPFFSFYIQTSKQPHQFKPHKHVSINKHK